MLLNLSQCTHLLAVRIVLATDFGELEYFSEVGVIDSGDPLALWDRLFAMATLPFRF